MDKKEIIKRNQALTAYMGGPEYLRKKFYFDLLDEEVELITPEELYFNDSWDWAIPVWSKIRKDMSPMMVISAISAIDTEDIKTLYIIMSQVAIDWCINNKINL